MNSPVAMHYSYRILNKRKPSAFHYLLFIILLYSLNAYLVISMLKTLFSDVGGVVWRSGIEPDASTFNVNAMTPPLGHPAPPGYHIKLI